MRSIEGFSRSRLRRIKRHRVSEARNRIIHSQSMTLRTSLEFALQPFRPPIETIRHYDLHKLRRDLLAGLTVSVVEVPQAMAYALIAGVPPVYGLYTSILQGI